HDPSGLDDEPGPLSRFWTWLNTPINPELEKVQGFWQEHRDEVEHEARTSGSWSYFDAMRLAYVQETSLDVQSVPNTPLGVGIEFLTYATAVHVSSRNKDVNKEPPGNKEPSSATARTQDVSTSVSPAPTPAPPVTPRAPPVPPTPKTSAAAPKIGPAATIP